ncbi:MAG: undecaprenyl-phosphate glucose phosphotransferase [Hyphomicrobiaceae bacterium]|nr:undecaprenyl-phosphate glucose phosphotransferase [Hyphomicrobiaceae bacterium]
MPDRAAVSQPAEADVFATPEHVEPPARAELQGPAIRTPRVLAEAPSPSLPKRRISPLVYSGLVRLAEFSLVTGLGFAVAYAYVDEYFRQYAAALALTGVAASFVFEGMGLYRTGALAAAHRHLPALVAGWTATVGVMLAALFFLKVSQDFSRAWIAIWYVAGIGALIAFRSGITALTRRSIASGSLIRRAVVYGTGETCASMIHGLNQDPDNDIKIVAVFDERGPGRGGGVIEGYPNLGGIDALMAYCRANPVDMLIVALPVSAEGRLLGLVKKLWVLPVDIRLAAQASKLRFRPRAYSFAGNVPLIDLVDRPIADWDKVLKWTFDKIVGTLALIALSPVMAAVAVAIKLDSKGPVLFRQKRMGFNNEIIEVYKFRSMYTDMTDANASKLVTKDDPRVTRVGRIIRKTSLDELPQLFNVLIGTLSLVGPRPHALQSKAADRLYHDVVDGYFARHKVKPGITGWAQINGWRGETDTAEKIEKRVECDIYYIENWSVLLDLYILFRTPFSLLSTENAY